MISSALTRQLEVIFIIVSGVIALVFDSSLFHLQPHLEELWNYEFSEKFSKYNIGLCIKYILTGVIFVRTFTLHIFLALYVVMLWPAIFGNRPNLMLPWLAVGFVRCILVNLVTLTIGSYICVIQKSYHLICLDFFLSQMIEHGPSAYAWCVIFSHYHYLQEQCKEKQKKKSQIHEAILQRKKGRSFFNQELKAVERMLSGSSDIGNLSESTVYNFLHQIETDSDSHCQSRQSRSLDTLLKAHLGNESSWYYNLNENEDRSLTERVKELLQVTEEDIDKIKSQIAVKRSEEIVDVEELIKTVTFNKSASVERDKPIENEPEIESSSIDTTETPTKCRCRKYNRKIDMKEIELRSIIFDKFYRKEDSDKKPGMYCQPAINECVKDCNPVSGNNDIAKSAT